MIQLDDPRFHWRWRMHPACNGGNTPRFVGHHSDTVVATSKCTKNKMNSGMQRRKKKAVQQNVGNLTLLPHHFDSIQATISNVDPSWLRGGLRLGISGWSLGYKKNYSRELQDDHVVLPIIEQRHLETSLKGICLNLFVGW